MDGILKENYIWGLRVTQKTVFCTSYVNKQVVVNARCVRLSRISSNCRLGIEEGGLLRCVIRREGRAFLLRFPWQQSLRRRARGLLLSLPSLQYTNTFVAVLPHMTRCRRCRSNTQTYSKPRRLLTFRILLNPSGFRSSLYFVCACRSFLLPADLL